MELFSIRIQRTFQLVSTPTACHTAVPIIIYGYLCIPLYPYSDRRTYRYRRISMSGGIIAFPIRVCHGLDSNILDKLLT